MVKFSSRIYFKKLILSKQRFTLCFDFLVFHFIWYRSASSRFCNNKLRSKKTNRIVGTAKKGPIRAYSRSRELQRDVVSWLTNSALVYEPKCGGGGSCGASANEYSCVHRSTNKLRRSNSIFNLWLLQSEISQVSAMFKV